MQTDQAMQEFLDSLSQAPGSVLVRGDIEWEALLPGNEGHALTIGASGRPEWQTQTPYRPAAVKFTGAGGQYSKNLVTVSNNTHNLMARLRFQPHGATRSVFLLWTASQLIAQLAILSNGRLYCVLQGTGPTLLNQLISIDTFDNDAYHTVQWKFNPTNGATELLIDQNDQDNPAYGGRTAIPGTLPSTGSANLHIGQTNTPNQPYDGYLSYIGWKLQNGLDFADFLDDFGKPKQLDITTWTEWAGQPPLWHESAALNDNRGSLGPFTKAGGVSIAPPETWM